MMSLDAFFAEAIPLNSPVYCEEGVIPDADLPGAAITVGDFHDDDEAAAFAAAARAAGVPVNVIDKPAHCDFSFGAIVNRSPLVDRHFDGWCGAGLCPRDPWQDRRAAAERVRALGCCCRALARRGAGVQPVFCRPAQVFWELFAAHAPWRMRATRTRST